jgi:DNA polymerase-3 subunit epsilon
MRFDELEFAAVDFESSGFGADGTDEPIQIGIALMKGANVVIGESLRSFIAPLSPRPISDAAYAVHRIGSEQLRGAPTMIELWPEIRERLGGRVVVAHGAGTEKRFLRAFPMHGFGPWLDTLPFARKAIPQLGKHSLGALLDHFELVPELRRLCPALDWHDAHFDAVASLLLLRELVSATDSADAPLLAFGLE